MTLTQAAILVRKVSFWILVVVVLLLFLRITVSFSTAIFRRFFPKPQAAPNVAFGKLTPYDFSQNVVQDTAGVSFQIQTIEGSLPNLGDRAAVFKVIEKPPTILFGEQARQQAAKIGFSQNPKIINERIYQFSDPNLPGKELEIDVISGNFKYKNNPNLYPELLSLTGSLDKEETIRAAKSFLSQLAKFQKDFTDDKITITPLKIEGGVLVSARSLADAQIVRVGFGRADFDKNLQVLPLDVNKPNVWVEITPLREPSKQIFQASYFYYPVDTQKSATYPIKSTQTAFEELAAGAGIIVGEKTSQMSIRRIYLAYPETTAPMKYFMPVYVFAGDNFFAFIPAVPAEWLGP